MVGIRCGGHLHRFQAPASHWQRHSWKEAISMYVGQIMRTNLVTATPDTSLIDVRDLIAQQRVEHLLVVNKKAIWSASSRTGM